MFNYSLHHEGRELEVQLPLFLRFIFLNVFIYNVLKYKSVMSLLFLTLLLMLDPTYL